MANLKLQTLLLVVLSLGQFSLCQDCSQLDVDFTGAAFQDYKCPIPPPGSDLPVCAQRSPQCCTSEYIDRVREEVREELLDGLRDEFEETVEGFERVVRGVIRYMSSDFADEYISRIPFGDRITDLDPINSQLAVLERSFEVTGTDTFNAEDFVSGFFAAFENIVAEILSSGNTNLQDCIVTAIRGQIRDNTIRAIAREFNRIRESILTNLQILSFLKSFNDTLGGFEPLPACINGLVERSFCGRCTRRVPPLCSNVCGAIVRGCFAGFHTGIGQVFDRRLWNIARQLIRFTDRSIMDIYTLGADAIDDSAQLLRDLTSCGVNPSTLTNPVSGRRRREDDASGSASDETPDDDDVTADDDDETTDGSEDSSSPDDDYSYIFLGTIAEELDELNGAFDYSREGPEFCRDREDDDSDGDGSCDDNSVCTASVNCWDGDMEIAEDIEEFTGEDIEDQASNPVLQLNPVELESQAAALTQQVDVFVEGDQISNGAPEGLVIPSGDDSGAVVTMATVAVVLLTTLVALIL